ncbi:hypothetical protein HZI73_26285 (plasmid) [Vallitalea pronyensis]|uniref:Uncharacterized protein n=1 Tax=Vallitalea pronyensis TaxID=1348613 RepID=A0A8J8MQT3_9FIRM|nr:hypothetical protein [Vallitalea pronyensis]QUI25924.1 hypothetical protein HZI73_26285 [Vallitalea pronyensis]
MKIKKIVVFTLVLSILLTNIHHKAFAATNSNPLSYEGISGQIPFETLSLPPDYKNKPYITVNISGKNTKLWFNTELWVDKNIGVYGHYAYVPSNDFKNYTENPDPSIKTPYYTRDGVKGEYRYHGYTVDGIRHTNKSFPIDQASTRQLEDKTWQYRYWLNPVLKAKKDGIVSNWNEDAIRWQNQDTQQWINDGMKDNIDLANSINRTNSSAQAYDYANVLTPSTLYSYGEAKMWHQNNSGYWYQTFTLNKRDGRKQTPVTLDINILDKGKHIMNVGKDSMSINVDVTITLKDEAYYDDIIEREIYYTRRDISHYNLDLNGTTYKFNGNSTTNTYSGTVNLDILRNNMSDNGDYEVKGIASVSYGEPKSDNAYATDTDKVNQKEPIPKFNKSDDLKSLFGSATLVLFSDDEPLNADKFSYRDLSRGSITKYKFELIGEDSTIVTREYNTSSVNSQTVNNLLYDLAKNKGDTYEVTLKQTVYNDSKSDTYERVIIVKKAFEQKEIIEIDIDLPDKVFDIETYEAKINGMDQKDIDRLKVTIDGTAINVTVPQFFGDGFSFGAIESNNNTEVHLIEVSATSDDDIKSFVQRWVTVYNTKPKAQLALQGTQKENRKFEAINTSDNANDPYLLQHYPTSYTYQVTAINGDMNKFHYEQIGENYTFQGAEEGIYQISCIATNRSGRSSTYNLPLVVMKDHVPAMSFDIWNNYLARSESLSMNFGVESIDGDTIINKRIKILKDTNKDGTYETSILDTELTDSFTYTPSELGHYRAIILADEAFGQETITKWLDGTEKRSNEIIRDFFVENLRPLTEIYLDIPFNFPQVDVIIAVDKNLSDSNKSQIKSKRIEYNNYLREQGINPTIEIWDMKVYQHSTPASTSRNTGSSYPSSSISYSSGDYFGTLTRYSVANNSYWQDFGYYTTEQECHTEERVVESWTCSDSRCADPWGCMMGTGKPWHTCGTRKESVTVCNNVTVWHSDNRLINNYTGYYSGTIYKYVRQEPPISSFRTNSDKYIIYVSQSGINVTASSEHQNRLSPIKEFTDLVNEHDFDVTLIGTDTIKSQSVYDHYFDTTDIMGNITKALDNIIGDNSFSSDYLMEVGQSINIETVELETEGDGIKESGFKYIHNPNYYDNSMGMYSYAESTFVDDNNWITTKPSILDKSGRLEMHHKAKDSILGYEAEELFSNIFKISVNIHRRPIAVFSLDWTYDPVLKHVRTTWVDSSYDLDHQYSDPNKGIIDRKIVYWNNAYPTEKFYKIPDNLQTGATYTISYTVKDIEKTWSDPNIQQITIATVPPPQILDAKLKTELTKFNINSVPASENLVLYDTVTRFPYNHHLEMALYSGSTIRTTNKSVSLVHATKNGDNYNWNNITYNVPSTLPDGNYTFKLLAIDDNNSNNKVQKDFNVTVKTPINLVGSVDDLTEGTPITITATTSKYANSVSLELYKGTSYSRTLTMNNTSTVGDIKTWEVTYTPNGVPEGNYTAEFTARTPNGNIERVSNNFRLNQLAILSMNIWGEWNYWRGQVNLFGKQLLNMPHRFLSYEKVHIETEIKGNPDQVYVRFSPELEAMIFTNQYGHTYSYSDHIGYTVNFPLNMTSSDGETYKVEYILPLAESTMNDEDTRLGGQYWVEVTAVKGSTTKTMRITDIDITGNTLDKIYIQPE